jgi:cell wall-associated NlpC family hydrolase
LKAGETLSTVAKRFHVSIQDLEAANHLTDHSVLRIGRTVAIPGAPKKLVLRPKLYVFERVSRARVSVRLGPGEQFHRVAVLDIGRRAVVTARRSGWAQVALPGGKFGWVREDMLAGHKAAGEIRSARAAPTAPAGKPGRKRHGASATAVADNRRRRASRLAHGAVGPGPARKAHERQHPARVASSSESRRSRHARHIAALRRAERQARRHSRRSMVRAPGGDLVRTAYAYRGTPYRWGGASGRGFDCSGFTSYLYHRVGVSLPHSASGQFRYGRRVDHKGLRPGDLVFFHTVHSGISHVGMYVGNGKFVHASSRRAGGVRVDTLSSGYYRNRFRGARRMR